MTDMPSMSERARPKMPKMDVMIDAINMRVGLPRELLVRSRRSRIPTAARVTMIPVAVEISSAGTCVTMPSPTVSNVKCASA